MLVSIEVQGLEEDFVGVDSLVGDLELVAMAGKGKTFELGESLVSDKIIEKMEEAGYFLAGRADPPPLG